MNRHLKNIMGIALIPLIVVSSFYVAGYVAQYTDNYFILFVIFPILVVVGVYVLIEMVLPLI